MFEFKAHIVKRRKFSKRYFLLGLIAAGLLGYASITFIQKGIIPFVEMIIAQIGIYNLSNWIYLGVFALLVTLLIPAIRTIIKKKTIVGGTVTFDEDKLEIKKGREHLVIPEKELTQLNFELKKLPDPDKKSKDKLFGGSFMKIPTTKGVFECELDINTKHDQDKLLEMIEFLKIEHDVKVELKEIK
jgi:hypothetical protein